MKCVLIISVIALFSAAGIYKADKLVARRKEIESIIDLLEEIRRKIGYFESPLEAIIYEYSPTNHFEFLSILKSYLQKTDFPDAWRLAFEESSSQLDESERQAFCSIGKELGSSDSDSQDKLISYTLTSFKKKLEKAETDENENKRLYIVMGVATGLAASVLIM